MPTKIDWRNGAQAGIFYLLGLFVIVSVLYIGLSYGIAIISDANAGILASGAMHTSQQRTNTLNLVLNYWYVIPIVVGILGFIWILKYGVESDEGGSAY